MLRKLISAVVVCGLCSPVSDAQDRNESASSVIVAGAGSASCGQIVETMKHDEGRFGVIQWTLGYISAWNRLSDREIKPPDMPAGLAYIDRYCRERPLSTMLSAVDSLIEDLSPKPNK